MVGGDEPLLHMGGDMELSSHMGDDTAPLSLHMGDTALSLHMGVRVLREVERRELKNCPTLTDDWQSESNKLCGGIALFGCADKR